MLRCLVVLGYGILRSIHKTKNKRTHAPLSAVRSRTSFVETNTCKLCVITSIAHPTAISTPDIQHNTLTHKKNKNALLSGTTNNAVGYQFLPFRANCLDGSHVLGAKIQVVLSPKRGTADTKMYNHAVRQGKDRYIASQRRHPQRSQDLRTER